jgi:RNA polymerase sigma-70 factor (ECF subfamily)
MIEPPDHDIRAQLDEVFRTESRYVLATLVRSLGDFDLAEESLQEAYSIAALKWPSEGVPKNSRSWLISTARFKAIDRIRRDKKLTGGLEVAESFVTTSPEIDQIVDERIGDDLLRLIFICCHPSLLIEAQVALTLREVCGLSTGEIAQAFLVAESTMAQRISRAKAKLRNTGAILESPSASELEGRLSSVLRVIYLVFNEGYYASSGESLTSGDLSGEAIRVGALLSQLMPHQETFGLNALMSLSEARRFARDRDGKIILLEDQDRSIWDQNLISMGNRYLKESLARGKPGPYTLQASIAAEHANVRASSDTDWGRIVQLYDQLDFQNPSPIVKLNRAVAVAMAGQIQDGLEQITSLIDQGDLSAYGLAYAAKADLLRRLGKNLEAKDAYIRALDLAQMTPEREFLRMRIGEIDQSLVRIVESDHSRPTI